MHIDHLEFAEPTDMCEIHAGTFYWTSPQGQDTVTQSFTLRR